MRRCNTCAKVFKEPSVLTLSWRWTLGKEDGTPRSLGASDRMGQNEQTGPSARRKISGRSTVRMAAQQEKGVAFRKGFRVQVFTHDMQNFMQ